MILALDIGNTEIKAGVFSPGAGEIKRVFAAPSVKGRESGEYAAEFSRLLSGAGCPAEDIEAAVVASVVPPLDVTINEALSGGLGIRPLRVGVELSFGMQALVDDPSEVGDDRLVNALAAYAAYGGPVIVVDFGTAITFDLVTASGAYAGGVIAPGIGTSTEALFARAAKLARVEVTRPSRVIGRSTVEAVRSGVYWGFTGLVDGVIERMTGEAGEVKRVVATGGGAGLVSNESRYIDEIDELLTLKGLRILYERAL